MQIKLAWVQVGKHLVNPKSYKWVTGTSYHYGLMSPNYPVPAIPSPFLRWYDWDHLADLIGLD
jgi:hypothetical protein